MNENKDVCELADITVSRVIEQLGDPKLLASKLVSTLGELTKQDSAEEDIGIEGAKYHATRLALELGNAKHDSDKDRRYINRIWKDLVEAFDVIQPSIENDAREAEYRKILKPRKTDPKTGRVEFYFEEVELEASLAEFDVRTHTKDGKPIVKYKKTKNPKAGVLGRAFATVLLTMPKYNMIAYAFPVSLLFIAWLYMEYMLSGTYLEFANVITLLVSLLFMVAFVFRGFYQVLERMIIMAPFWMLQHMGSDKVQLEVRDSGVEDANGETIPEVGLVVYSSECPVCGGDVYVDRGSANFRGRLIGRCSASPVEHIYSFDHITQKGVPLRSDTYLG